MKQLNKRIGIIGAGVSGMTAGHMLRDTHEVVVYEWNDAPGGLIRCKDVDGNLFHQCGGHVFNTKNEVVRTWFENKFELDKEFIHVERNSVIAYDELRIPYPIENYLYYLPIPMQQHILSELLHKDETIRPKNFEEFLKQQFGDTLYEFYFKPYNQKIWRADLSSISLEWLAGKLPNPSVAEILLSNINHTHEKSFVHSSFWYPKHGGSQFLANRLAEGLDLRYNSHIERIHQADGDGWIINNELYGAVFFCGNIKQLPSLLPLGVLTDSEVDRIRALAYHGTTTVLCEIENNPYTWIYLPKSDYRCHRIICTGNLSPANNATGKRTATVEFTDYTSKEEIVENLFLVPFALKYITHVYNEYTYPIQTADTREFISHLKNKLRAYGIYLSGRFADWEYYNMDVAMSAAMKQCEIFLSERV